MTTPSMKLLSAAKVAAGPIVSDAFTRADSASTMGTADTGQTWTPLTGAWGISSNRAYFVSGPGQSTTAIDSGASDCTVTVTQVVGGDVGLCWRLTDANNNWVMNVSTGQVYKRVAGTFTLVATTTAIANGSVVSIVMSGNNHEIFDDGVSIGSWSDSFNSTATRHGLRSNGTAGARWDNFLVEAP